MPQLAVPQFRHWRMLRHVPDEQLYAGFLRWTQEAFR